MEIMTKRYNKQLMKLSLELDEYIIKHPKEYDKIPDKAVIMITLKYDKKFSDDSIALVRSHNPKQQIIKAEKAKTRWSLTPFELVAV